MVICIISVIVFLFALLISLTYFIVDFYLNDNIDLDELYKEIDNEENNKEKS